uniref:Protein phosphatase n=1 Tax=Salix viminalis TaxID=40686 RepID=A0A6N2LS28_SALVM
MIIKKRSLSDFQATVSVSDDDESSGRLKMDMGTCYFPKDFDSNPESLGQDAHFICQERQAFGVADGVGGWARKGIDSGIFARELMSNYLASLRSLNPCRAVDLKETLLKAHSKTGATGSSTACVVSLEGDRLCYANVGDSGFMVFRGKRLVYRSPTQQNYFNRPFSLGNWVGEGKRPVSVFLGEFDVEQGDVVVAGSDGVFDNLFGSEIEEILQESDGESWPQDLAWSIATVASMNSVSQEYDSPFAIAAESEGIEHVGGKIDDITAIVAVIELDQPRVSQEK